MARAFIEVLLTKEKHLFDSFLTILHETDCHHLANPLKAGSVVYYIKFHHSEKIEDYIRITTIVALASSS